MNVKVNKEDIVIFRGAKAKHAILRYILKNKLDAKRVDDITIYDKYGHKIDQDAPLKENSSITFKFN
ncbi:MAG: hypothetical protein IKI67_01730 [Bacteroidales bacterium]|nr:hypothetical protein [Bacteroidales bacterium]